MSFIPVSEDAFKRGSIALKDLEAEEVEIREENYCFWAGGRRGRAFHEDEEDVPAVSERRKPGGPTPWFHSHSVHG